VRAILEPEELRPPGRGKVTAEALRKAALDAVRADPAPRLRMRLAPAAVDPRQPPSLRKPLQGILSEQVDGNLDAMTVMFGNITLDGVAKKDIEKFLLSFGHKYIAAILRIPVVPVKPGSPLAPDATPEIVSTHTAARVAPAWNGDLTTTVGRELALLESLSSHPGLIELAATIPNDGTRAALYAALRRNWQDGTQNWSNEFFTRESIWDPGLLVSVKLMHPGLTEKADQTVKVKSHLTKHKAVRGPLPGVKDDNQLRVDWLHFQYSLLTELCKQLSAAGEVQAGVAGKRPTAGGDAEPPIPLHEDARVATRFNFDWPKDLPDGVPLLSVGETQVKYVHIQQTTKRLMGVVSHYRHQLDSPAEHKLQDGSALWLESHKRLPDSERCRSVDVIIKRAKKAYDPHDLEDKIMIDVLLIEVNDPRHAPGKEEEPGDQEHRPGGGDGPGKALGMENGNSSSRIAIFPFPRFPFALPRCFIEGVHAA